MKKRILFIIIYSITCSLGYSIDSDEPNLSRFRIVNELLKKTAEPADYNHLPQYASQWRNILTVVDDVYTIKDIKHIRDDAMQHWADAAAISDINNNPKERARWMKKATDYLVDAIENLKNLEKAQVVKMNEESILAQGELAFKAELFSNVIANYSAKVSNISNPSQRAQLIYYLHCSYIMTGDNANADKQFDILYDDFPKESDRLGLKEVDANIDSKLREVALHYRYAVIADSELLKSSANNGLLKSIRSQEVIAANNMLKTVLKKEI